MSADGFTYEGRDVTAAQLKREITAYSTGKLQSALEAGNRTRAGVIAFCEARLVAAHRKNCAGSSSRRISYSRRQSA